MNDFMPSLFNTQDDMKTVNEIDEDTFYSRVDDASSSEDEMEEVSWHFSFLMIPVGWIAVYSGTSKSIFFSVQSFTVSCQPLILSHRISPRQPLGPCFRFHCCFLY